MSQWWAQFDDPVLAQLVAWAESDSPSLVQAWSRITQARATLRSTRAGAQPSLTGSGSSTRSTQEVAAGQSRLSTVSSIGLDASWELDLFGKVRRHAEAADARVDARVADWHDARISLAAEVADTYVQYRACGLLADAHDRQLASVSATALTTDQMVRAGLSAQADAVLAQASLANSRSTAIQQRAECTLLLKSLVYLTGRDEPALLQRMGTATTHLPQPAALRVDAVPAQVLRQRPDLAALERELAAASAEVGAAQADLYPSLTLSGNIGRSLLTSGSPYTTWSFGPQLSLPLFDAGRRSAAVDSATASYESALAAYRQGVRSAVKEVEQALVHLDSAVRRAGEARRAAEQYQSYFATVEAGWRAGSKSMLELEEARRSALSAEIQDIGLQQGQVSYWIALYKAVGGDWTPGATATAPAPPSPDHTVPGPPASQPVLHQTAGATP